MNFAFSNLGDLIDRHAEQAKLALIDLAGGVTRLVTYGELDALANAVARGLSRRGLQKGERVAILAQNSTENLATLYGAERAGLVPVPVNWRFPPATIEFVVRDSGATWVFHDAANVSAVPPGVSPVAFGSEAWRALLDQGPFDAIKPVPDEPALILYTSGSTGRPKGVVLSHQSHLWVVEQRLKGHDISRERCLIAAPLYHMNGLALAQLASAAHITVVLLPRFDARSYLQAISDHKVTWITGVPPMMAMLFQQTDLIASVDLSVCPETS